MALLFNNPISTITGKPEPTMDEKVFAAKAMIDGIKNKLFPYVKKNVFPPAGENMHPGMKQSMSGNPAQFIDKSHPDYQPSIFAAPKNNMVLGQSGAWKTPLGKFSRFMTMNPSAPTESIMKGTGLSKYAVETLQQGAALNPVSKGVKGAGKKIKLAKSDYRGTHTAPEKEGLNSIDDLSDIYGDDIYGSKAAQYFSHYGDGGRNPADRASINIIQNLKNRPNKSVTIYRAVPHKKSPQEKIDLYERHKKHILKTGKVPSDAKTRLNSSAYYDLISDKIDKLKPIQKATSPSLKINDGDWVTINRTYAKEHGESQLNGEYKIIKKTIKAKNLFTDGNSIHEWGYHK